MLSGPCPHLCDASAGGLARAEQALSGNWFGGGVLVEGTARREACVPKRVGEERRQRLGVSQGQARPVPGPEGSFAVSTRCDFRGVTAAGIRGLFPACDERWW